MFKIFLLFNVLYKLFKEISPVLVQPDTNDDMDLPPMIQPLKLNKEWKPIITSTTTDFHRQHHQVRIPKTNPRHLSVSSTPRHHLINRLRPPQVGAISVPIAQNAIPSRQGKFFLFNFEINFITIYFVRNS